VPDELLTLEFANARAWERWLAKEHARSNGIWLRMRKKGAPTTSVNYSDALDVALCYGWIDGQVKSLDEHSYVQRFTPRRARSRWSKLNVERIARLTEANRMQAAGIAQVVAAKADGRWAAAYAPPSERTVPDDFLLALNKNRKAKAFFATLDRRNIYAISYQLEDAKRPETRERRIRMFIERLARGEKLYP
jgi:uncharacterized protein YdeI (YjbR/CyaY-like superfamily)